MKIEKTAVASPLPRFCKKHGMEIKPFYSKKQDKWFWLHQVKDPITGNFTACFVNSEEEQDAWWDKQFDYANDSRGLSDDYKKWDEELNLGED